MNKKPDYFKENTLRKTTSISPSLSIMDNIKQGFGFGMGAEIGRKSVDAIVHSVTNSSPTSSQYESKSCEQFMQKYMECMNNNHYHIYCEHENESYEECKKKQIK